MFEFEVIGYIVCIVDGCDGLLCDVVDVLLLLVLVFELLCNVVEWLIVCGVLDFVVYCVYVWLLYCEIVVDVFLLCEVCVVWLIDVVLGDMCVLVDVMFVFGVVFNGVDFVDEIVVCVVDLMYEVVSGIVCELSDLNDVLCVMLFGLVDIVFDFEWLVGWYVLNDMVVEWLCELLLLEFVLCVVVVVLDVCVFVVVDG